MNDIAKRARQLVQEALDLKRQLAARPLNNSGKEFLRILDATARYVMRGLTNPALQADSQIEGGGSLRIPDHREVIQAGMAVDDHATTNFQTEVSVLELLMSDPRETLLEAFALDVAKADYGIEFCEKGIKTLEAKEARLRGSSGCGFDPKSPDYTQLENFRILLKRFSAEKERGVAPSYNPKAFEQFA